MASTLKAMLIIEYRYNKTGIPPVFSIALSRDNDTGGVLAFGGLPADVPFTGDFRLDTIIAITYVVSIATRVCAGVSLGSHRR